MLNIEEIQNKVFKKIQEISNKKKIIHNNLYFCAFNFSIGYALLKFFKEKNFLLIFKIFFKEILNIILMNNYELKNKIDKKYKKIIVTWGNESNIKKNFYYDKYFNQKSIDTKEILWIVIFTGNQKKINQIETQNVLFIIERKISLFKKIIFLLKLIFSYIFKEKYSLVNFLFYFTWHNAFKLKIRKLFLKVIHNDLELLILPYEGQPFQLDLLEMTKSLPKILTKGYIHSVPSYPSHLIYKKNYPKELIVSSQDQFNFLKKRFLPNNYKIHLLESARFRKSDPSVMNNRIFLPIEFFSEIKILNELKFLFLNEFNNLDLSKFRVKNHPTCANSTKHLKLIYKIESLRDRLNIKNDVNTFNKSIFIGSTGSIIEALELDIEVYHITEDPILESYSEFIWNNLKVSNYNENTYKYFLKEKNYSMIFGKDKNIFNEYTNK